MPGFFPDYGCLVCPAYNIVILLCVDVWPRLPLCAFLLWMYIISFPSLSCGRQLHFFACIWVTLGCVFQPSRGARYLLRYRLSLLGSHEQVTSRMTGVMLVFILCVLGCVFVLRVFKPGCSCSVYCWHYVGMLPDSNFGKVILFSLSTNVSFS